MRRLPMFPLGSPLLPGALLPLHVFELRYRMMFDDLMTSEAPEFGVVMIERGHEVGGGDVRSDVGTIARVIRSEEADDGRRAVLAVGVDRLKVLEWLPDDPYPAASVEAWPVDDGNDHTDLDAVTSRVERFCVLLQRLDDRFASPGPRTIDEGVVDYLYRMAAVLPLGPADRQRVLTAESVSIAASTLIEAIDDLDALVRFRVGLPTDEDT